jgi:hypothetical protein
VAGAASDEVPDLPLIVQTAPDRPVFRGVGDDGRDVFCGSCGEVVLLENVPADAVLDLAIECASCSGVSRMPARPSGRGLGGVLRVVKRDHRAVGTFVMDMDEVIAGEQAVRSRAYETGGDLPETEPALMDIAGIEQVIHDARATFEPILKVARPTPAHKGPAKHRLLRLIERLEESVRLLRGGDNTVDVYSVMSLQRATSVFRRWARDPSSSRLMQESTQPEAFDHNAVLLQVATLFEHARLGPELVPPSAGRTPDLILRIFARRWIQVDTKTPRALQRPAESVILPVEPRQTIRKALRSSRGQFTTPGILVIAGDFWIGGLDAYAAATALLLNAPLAQDASPEAQLHYRRLLGVVLVSTGYEVDERTYRARLYARWVPSPRYSEHIALTLPPELDGPFTISIRPSSESSEPDRPGEEDSDSGATATFESEVFDPARFRLVGDDEVEADGAIVNSSPSGSPERTLTFRFPEGFRPPVAIDFDVACEVGFTVVTVDPEGSLLADPSVGWISLHGVRFRTAA